MDGAVDGADVGGGGAYGGDGAYGGGAHATSKGDEKVNMKFRPETNLAAVAPSVIVKLLVDVKYKVNDLASCCAVSPVGDVGLSFAEPAVVAVKRVLPSASVVTAISVAASST